MQVGPRFRAASRHSGGSAGASVWRHPVAPGAAGSSLHSGHKVKHTTLTLNPYNNESVLIDNYFIMNALLIGCNNPFIELSCKMDA